ncbi:MAG: hypothetical protein K2L60_09780 [Bacteroides sp.]|nr:hypothetical protein [Bacteroides sp.]
MIFLSLCIVFMVRVLRYSRTINIKNRSMVKTINKQMDNKAKLLLKLPK